MKLCFHPPSPTIPIGYWLLTRGAYGIALTRLTQRRRAGGPAPGFLPSCPIVRGYCGIRTTGNARLSNRQLTTGGTNHSRYVKAAIPEDGASSKKPDETAVQQTRRSCPWQKELQVQKLGLFDDRKCAVGVPKN